MTRFALSLLGPVQATLNGQMINHFAYDKVRALLVYLAVEAGTAHCPRCARRTAVARAAQRCRADEPAAGAHHLAPGASTMSDAHPPVLLITRKTIQFNPACDHALDVMAFQTLVAISTDIEPVPVIGLAAHFSPLPRMAPPFVSWIVGAQVPSNWLPLYLRRRAMGWQGVHR